VYTCNGCHVSWHRGYKCAILELESPKVRLISVFLKTTTKTFVSSVHDVPVMRSTGARDALRTTAKLTIAKFMGVSSYKFVLEENLLSPLSPLPT
jgi:hypothetical protein